MTDFHKKFDARGATVNTEGAPAGSHSKFPSQPAGEQQPFQFNVESDSNGDGDGTIVTATVTAMGTTTTTTRQRPLLLMKLGGAATWIPTTSARQRWMSRILRTSPRIDRRSSTLFTRQQLTTGRALTSATATLSDAISGAMKLASSGASSGASSVVNSEPDTADCDTDIEDGELDTVNLNADATITDCETNNDGVVISTSNLNTDTTITDCETNNDGVVMSISNLNTDTTDCEDVDLDITDIDDSELDTTDCEDVELHTTDIDDSELDTTDCSLDCEDVELHTTDHEDVELDVDPADHCPGLMASRTQPTSRTASLTRTVETVSGLTPTPSLARSTTRSTTKLTTATWPTTRSRRAWLAAAAAAVAGGFAALGTTTGTIVHTTFTPPTRSLGTLCLRARRTQTCQTSSLSIRSVFCTLMTPQSRTSLRRCSKGSRTRWPSAPRPSTAPTSWLPTSLC